MRSLAGRRLAASALTTFLLAGAAGGHEAPPPPPEVARSAQGFLATLRPEVKAECVLPLTDPDRLEWGYLPGRRSGVPLQRLNAAERGAAFAMLRASMSSRGAEKAEGVLELEGILRDLTGSSYRDPGLYYLAIYGEPSDEKPWAWRLEGHHLSLHFTSWSGAIVSATPAFLGANPARVPSGRRAGWRLLGEEEDLARRLLEALDAGGRAVAVLSRRAPGDILFGPGRKRVPDPAGLAQADMPPPARAILERLVGEYLGNLRPDVAGAQREKIRKAGWGKVRFAWAGGSGPGEGHYYRIQGPTFVIEYDNTQDGANHVHSVFRDLDNDFGGDLLARHYAESHRQLSPVIPSAARDPGLEQPSSP